MIHRRTRKRYEPPHGGGLPRDIANIVKRELITNTSFWEHLGNISHTTALLSNYQSLRTSIDNIKNGLGKNPRDHCLEEGIIAEYNNIMRTVVELAKYAPDKYKIIMKKILQEIAGSKEVQSNKHILEQLSKKNVRIELQKLLSTLEQLSPYLEDDSKKENDTKKMFMGVCELGQNILKDPVFNYSERLLEPPIDLRDIKPWKSVNSIGRRKTMKQRSRLIL